MEDDGKRTLKFDDLGGSETKGDAAPLDTQPVGGQPRTSRDSRTGLGILVAYWACEPAGCASDGALFSLVISDHFYEAYHLDTDVSGAFHATRPHTNWVADVTPNVIRSGA